MTAPNPKEGAWPVLSWDVPGEGAVAWFQERARALAERVRAFEVVLEKDAGSRDFPLSLIEAQLAEWNEHAETVFMYFGLCRSNEVEEAAVPYFVEELEPVSVRLGALREGIYQALGARAAHLRKTEATTKVSEAQLVERVEVYEEGPEDATPPEAEEADEPEAAPAGPEANDAKAAAKKHASKPQAGGAVEAMFGPPTPISVNELSLRQRAETKPLPAKLELVNLLANLPSEWALRIFDTLDLEDEENPDDLNPSPGRCRALVAAALKEPVFLEDLVNCLGDEALRLLKDLLARQGMWGNPEVITKYGSDAADGYFWADRPPAGPLSLLRRTGLAYVGSLQGRTMVVVPVELRPLLVPLLK